MSVFTTKNSCPIVPLFFIVNVTSPAVAIFGETVTFHSCKVPLIEFDPVHDDPSTEVSNDELPAASLESAAQPAKAIENNAAPARRTDLRINSPNLKVNL